MFTFTVETGLRMTTRVPAGIATGLDLFSTISAYEIKIKRCSVKTSYRKYMPALILTP